MNSQVIIAVGVDIGTTTTQMIISRLTLENTGGYGMAPKIEITKKEILHQSEIYFTPLKSGGEIDGAAVRSIISDEFGKAACSRDKIDTGAVIITGESSRKRNAEEVCGAISEFAGDFVAASCGPDLESVLAGKGSGCAELSAKVENMGKVCCNIDIGGGTSNLCCFEGGKTLSDCCLDIGGRLIKVNESGNITYIAPKLKALAERHGISLEPGDFLNVEKAEQVCSLMTHVLEAAVGLREKNADFDLLLTNHGLTDKPDIITFSGGVADCVANDYEDFRFGDIGVIFGRTLRKSRFFEKNMIAAVPETMRATVIGAGSFSLELSGGTIEYGNVALPLKAMPVIRLTLEKDSDIDGFGEKAAEEIKRFARIYENKLPAISFEGIKSPSFSQIERLAEQLSALIKQEGLKTLAAVTERDMAKALGQAVKRFAGRDSSFICIDGISCKEGDFIDIGTPVANGKAVPVTVRTLVFG